MYAANLELLKRTRAETLAMTAVLTGEQAAARPAPGEWSVNEVLEHLWISENLYRDMIGRLIALQRAGQRPMIIQTLAEIDTGVPFIPRAILPLMDVPLTFVNMFVPGFVREQMMQIRTVKAKTPAIAEPSSGKPLLELRRLLDEAIAATESLFAANADIDYRRLRHSHPMIGYNNVLQILRIVAFHEKRHQAQIVEILQSIRMSTVA